VPLLDPVWPFSRLVHAWSVPLSYLQRSWILYRSRNPRAALAFERERRKTPVTTDEPSRL
jgi:hypothetical protein